MLVLLSFYNGFVNKNVWSQLPEDVRSSFREEHRSFVIVAHRGLFEW